MTEHHATLTDLILTTDNTGGLGIIVRLADRGDFAFGIDADQMTGVIDALSGGALSLRADLPIPVRARFDEWENLVDLGHATRDRWVRMDRTHMETAMSDVLPDLVCISDGPVARA